MLKKLLKHEYKATARIFLPAYGIFAALLVVERLSALASTNLVKQGSFVGQLAAILMVLFTIATVVGLIAMILAPVIYAIIRFYRNMLGDEGYLSFTLPVTTGQHIWSKLLVAVTWEVVTVLVMGLCGTLFFLTIDTEATLQFFRWIGGVFSDGFQQIGAWRTLLIFMVLPLVEVLVQMMYNLLALYSAMSIGQTANKHKFLASVGTYLGIQFVTSMVIQGLVMCGLVYQTRWHQNAALIFSTPLTVEEAGIQAGNILCVVFLGAILINALLAAAHFFLCRYMLTKKLNLA